MWINKTWMMNQMRWETWKLRLPFRLFLVTGNHPVREQTFWMCQITLFTKLTPSYKLICTKAKPHIQSNVLFMTEEMSLRRQNVLANSLTWKWSKAKVCAEQKTLFFSSGICCILLIYRDLVGFHESHFRFHHDLIPF